MELDRDGIRAVTGSKDTHAFVWDLAAQQIIADLSDHYRVVNGVSFSPGGDLVVTASGDNDNFGRMFLLPDGLLVRAFAGHTLGLTSIQFSPDGSQVITGGLDNSARLWDIATGQQIRSLKGHTFSVDDVDYSPDGKQIVTASWDKTAKIWNAAAGTEHLTLTGHQSRLYAARFGPDGKTIMTASDDKTARLWDAQTGQTMRTFAGHGHWVQSVDYSPDGTRVLTGSIDGAARIWNISDLVEPYVPTPTPDPLAQLRTQADFNGDGRIGATDLFEFAAGWRRFEEKHDLDQDDFVDALDLLLFMRVWGDNTQ